MKGFTNMKQQEKEWLSSVYSDGTENFLSNPFPKLGEEITVYLRCLEDDGLQKIYLRMRPFGIEKLIEMKKIRVSHGLAYFGAKIKIEEKALLYQFYLVYHEKIYYYTQYQITDFLPNEQNNFVIVADYKPAAWVKNQIFYQILPDRFFQGNKENAVKSGEYSYEGYETIQVNDWNQPAAEFEVGHNLDFYGGDLDGICQKLDYLQELGITGIYINPIFLSPSIHKYDSLNYKKIDPHLGGDEALERLAKEMHKRNMRLMMDISINHTSSEAMWFNKSNQFFPQELGAYQNINSPYRDFYFWNEDGSYDTWCGVETMPKLNYESENLKEEIYLADDSVLKKWMKPPYNIDAWRFDVADCLARNEKVDVHQKIIHEIRNTLKEENPEIYLLAEDWADCSEDLSGNFWDGTMNYFGCARPIREFIGAQDLFQERNDYLKNIRSKMTASQLTERILSFYKRLPSVTQYQMFNLLDSHDVTRIYHEKNVKKEDYLGALMLTFGLPGAPSIYYGDEIFLDGRAGSNEGCRYPFNWEWEKNDVSKKIHSFYQKLIKVRKHSKAMQSGGFTLQALEEYIIELVRFQENEVVWIIDSTEDVCKWVTLNYKNYGIMEWNCKKDSFGNILETRMVDNRLQLKILPHHCYFIILNIE